MFNNKILILINFLIILVIILYFHTKKNKKEHFNIYEDDEYITKISGIRHNIAPGQTDDECVKEEEEVEVLLNTSKDHLVYNKFCYKKGKQDPTEKKYFVDNIQYTEEYKEEYEKESFDHKTNIGIVKSDSDYLGCYSVPPGELKDNLISNLNVNNYKTMTECKKDANKNNKNNKKNAIYFNSKITDKLGITDSGGNIQYKPVDEEDAHGKKSFCNTITDAQYKTLLTSHRVADKFCLGNSDLVGTNNLLSNSGRVKNYLGGIDTIAIYKNGSDITNQGKPTVVYQKTKLKSNLDCSNFVSLKCLQKFKKHVLGWYDIKNYYKIDVTKKNGNYDWDNKTLEIETNAPTSFTAPGDSAPSISSKKKFLLYDCSGNNNHMFPNYNKLHFIGNFKFNENRKAIIDDYSYYDSEGNETHLQTYPNTTFKAFYDEHKSNKSSDFFAVRKKNSQVINTAEFASISAIPSFDKLVKDSLTLRGNYQELPNLGMPEWNNSGKAHSRIVPEYCSGSKQIRGHECGCWHGTYNCHDLACQNWEQLATILKGTEGNGIFDDKGKIYPNPIHHSVTQILDSTAVDYFKGIDNSELVLKSQDKMFIESSHQLVKKLNKQFFICFSYKNYVPKTATTPKEHNHKNNNTHEHSAQTNENEFSINNQKTKNSIVGNPIFSLCSNFQSYAQTSDGGYKPQSFLWSFIDKYNGKNDNEGLLYVKPKKIGVITFKPGDGHKLCVSDIQIFDKDGNKKKLSPENVLIKRKDNKFKQDDDAILAKNLQDGNKILPENKQDTQNEEQSYCFTYNPYFIVAKLKWHDDKFKIPFRLATKSGSSFTRRVYGFKRTEGPDSVNHKGIQLSVIPTGGVEGERPNEVPMPGDDKYKVRNKERYHSHKHNTFSAKGTDDDEYVLILKEPIYISRIIIRSPIIDVTYDHQADEIEPISDALNLINLPGSKIDTSFKTTKMKLLDAEGTVYKNLMEQFVIEDGEIFKRDESDLTLTVPESEIVSQKSFADDIDDVEDIRLKNSVIDFWNVSFLKLKTNSEKKSVRIRGIQSIKNNDNDKYKISIFNVKENGNVEESEAFEVDEDYLKISQTNFSLKMGNLFNKHSDIQFKNLKIFSNEFVEDNKSAKEKSVSGKTNDIKDFNLENYRKSMTEETYKNIRNNILLGPNDNIYEFYHGMIEKEEDVLYKDSLISEGEKKKHTKNIFNIFSMLSDEQNSKDAKADFSIKKFNTTDHLQYQYDKNYAIGYIDLDNQDKGDKNTKILPLPGDLYYKNY